MTNDWDDELETLVVEVHDDILVVRLNRPERLNAIVPVMQDELERVWNRFDADPRLRVAILTGAGEKAFCSGADLKAIAGSGYNHNQVKHFRRKSQFTPWQAGVRKPTICAVNGVCAGGGLHFVSESDLSIAADHATFVDPHVSHGQVSAIETAVLSRRIPFSAVMRMVLLGAAERLDAATARELGLVSEVVASAELLPRAMELAGKIAANSPAAIAASRAALLSSLELPLDAAIQRGWELLQEHRRRSKDGLEGARAFAEKRPPVWEEFV